MIRIKFLLTKVFALALVLLVLNVISYNLSQFSIFEFLDLFLKGLPLIKSQIFKLDFYLSLPKLSIFLLWFFVGLFAYINYFTLDFLYTKIYNSLIYKFNYIKPRKELDVAEIKKFARFMIHVLIILSYTAIYTLLFTVFIPFGSFIIDEVSTATKNILWSYLILVPYWVISASILGQIFVWINQWNQTEELEEEHKSV